jgi:hypothetical protein
MSTEKPITLEDKFTKADLILDQTESSLRQMIESHRLGTSLIDEKNGWDESEQKPTLHKGGLETYKFEKDLRRGDGQYFWPRRSIRWVGDDGLCYLLQILPIDVDMEKFSIWSLVTQAPFGFPEHETFQRFTDINLPMPKEPFDQLLEENFQQLSQEGAKIKAFITSTPSPHQGSQS